MINETPEGGKRYPVSPDYQKPDSGSVRDIKAAANEAKESVKAEASRTGEELKRKGEEIASVAKERATDFAREQKEAGAKGIESFARAVGKAADELEETSPELARHARDAASQVRAISDALRERSVGGLLDDMTTYARREPTVFFGAAVVAGFALSRFLVARTDHSASTDESQYRRADSPGPTPGSRAGAQAAHRSQNRSGSAL